MCVVSVCVWGGEWGEVNSFGIFFFCFLRRCDFSCFFFFFACVAVEARFRLREVRVCARHGQMMSGFHGFSLHFCVCMHSGQ